MCALLVDLQTLERQTNHRLSTLQTAQVHKQLAHIAPAASTWPRLHRQLIYFLWEHDKNRM